MYKPLIGITCNTIQAEGHVMPGMVRTFVNSDYVSAVERAGGIPLLLPFVAEYESVLAQIGAVNGLILSGGPDIDPLLYGEEPLEPIGTVNHERDRYELLVVKAAEEQNKPLLGICRGAQVINVACGGSLYQDLSQIEGCNLKHFQTSAQRSALWHTVEVDPASRLAPILGGTALPVNSYHHQALKTIAAGFRVCARAKDGVVEAIEREGGRFVLGVQWHPEVLAETNPAMLALFQSLVSHSVRG